MRTSIGEFHLGQFVKIELLGTGNAFLPSGRTHSFLLIDEKILIDMPPTALFSLRKRGISPHKISTILFTHVHGDHIFGIPFFLLERKYISDREGLETLTIAGSPLVKDRVEELCELAYPGSLTEELEKIRWVDIPDVTGWRFERFEVLHDESVEPHGWFLEHETGLKLVHSGDSGPCETLWNQIKRADLAFVEMGIPEYVESEMHHKPSSILKLANENPSCEIIVTHTYIDSEYEILTKTLPSHPANVRHPNDGFTVKWNGVNLTFSE